MKRVKGLDTLRFILAFIVLLGHGAFPEVPELWVDRYQLMKVLNGIIGNSFVGIAAVMAFFIISGFCIHYPYSGGKSINIKEFYLKRITRIALPAIVAFLIYHYTLNLYMGVIWSLICEVIYYILYPIILRYHHKLNTIIILSFVTSYATSILYSLQYPYNGDFHRNGFALTWIVGLPVWLLGVRLANEIRSQNHLAIPTFNRIISLRTLAFFGAFVCSALRFHADIAYSYTLPILSIFLYYWLSCEISYFSNKSENKLLVFGGLMSYSLYLTHAYVIHVVKIIYSVEAIYSHPFLCMLVIALSLGIASIFYILIEKPAHVVSQKIKWNKKNAPEMVY